MMKSRVLERLGYRRLARDSRGSMAVEFALLLPAMTAIVFGITEFGVVMYNKIEMTDATRIAVRTLSIGRSTNTVRSDTVNSFNNSAPGINNPQANLTINVNGASCANDTACKDRLSSAIGGQAQVVATRPCRLYVTSYIIPSCTLTSSSTARIE